MITDFPNIAASDIGTVDTTAQNQLGQLGYGFCYIDQTTANAHVYATATGANIKRYDGNMYIYLKGVASTVVGSVVTWDANGLTTLATTSTAVGERTAVATGVTVASTWGWYLLDGVGVINAAAAAAAGAKLQTTATGGAVDDTTTANKYLTPSFVVTAATGAGTTTARFARALANMTD